MRYQLFKPIGIRQDNLKGTGYSSKYAHSIKNMRLTTNKDVVTSQWSDELGSIMYGNLSECLGLSSDNTDFHILGNATLGDTLVLFGKADVKGDTTGNIYDFIVTCSTNKLAPFTVLFKGNLSFSLNNPIETLAFYESEEVQKVYWTDNLNQPRAINIKSSTTNFNSDSFDFVPKLKLKETVTIEKLPNGGGLFPGGTVKYCITYYNKNGQESNIVYDSALYYPTIGDRACSPEEFSGDAFKIRVNNVDTNFDYIRLYSIVSTSNNTTPTVRVVEDLSLRTKPNAVIFTDTNTTGYTIDPSILSYIGGVPIKAKTFAQKNNTMFLGNISLLNKSLKSVIPNIASDTETSVKFTATNKNIGKGLIYLAGSSNSTYDYKSLINKYSSRELKIFKKGECYRIGIQCQDNTGAWSDVMYLKDIENNMSLNYLGNAIYKPIVMASIKASYVNSLISSNYKKARLVCCYPSNIDRNIIAQGILNPTVYNSYDRDNSIGYYSMASWFYRPLTNLESYIVNTEDGYSTVNYTTIPFKNHSYLSGYLEDRDYNIQLTNTEIQNSIIPKTTGIVRKDIYKIDRQVITFNSPEIRYDESIQTLPLENIKLKILGRVPINAYSASLYIDAETPAYDSTGSKRGEGQVNYVNKDHKRVFISDSNQKTHSTFGGGYWNDNDVYSDTMTNNSYYWSTSYPVYPFQKKGSLNNYIINLDVNKSSTSSTNNADYVYSVTRSATLNSKVIANLEYSKYPKYTPVESLSIEDCKIFNSKEANTILINNKTYGGNINTIAGMSDISYTYKRNTDTPEAYGKFSHSSNELEYTGAYPIYKKSGDNTLQRFGVSSEVIPITYNSMPHAVIYLSTPLSDKYDTNAQSAYLQLAELYRDIPKEDKFGGPSNLTINEYIPCGEAVTLTKNTDLVLYGEEGDHYISRYDDLKTYSRNIEDTNQVVEILSFMCESKINIDGRYDINRGLEDNTIITPTNFGLINMAYTQNNNFFTYSNIDETSIDLDHFPNQITWTKTKVTGELTDTWTNITLANIAEADGNKGSITKLLNYNDSILLFQDKGFAKVGYNEQTALSTENGVPLEIANSNKFSGILYISDKVGCYNKWSIVSTKSGVYFIDDYRKELNFFTSEGIQCLSDIHGMSTWLNSKLPKTKVEWRPSGNTTGNNNFISFYDSDAKDIYFNIGNTSLAFNELSKTFTSFYDYPNLDLWANIGNYSLYHSSKDKYIKAARALDTALGNRSITLCCDGVSEEGNGYIADKIFNTIEYRGDIYSKSHIESDIPIEAVSMYNDHIFNTLSASNEYQQYYDFNIIHPSPQYQWKAVRKFNVWRTPLPRACKLDTNGNIVFTNNRIRGLYCYITLKDTRESSSNRSVISDYIVYYTTK